MMPINVFKLSYYKKGKKRSVDIYPGLVANTNAQRSNIVTLSLRKKAAVLHPVPGRGQDNMLDAAAKVYTVKEIDDSLTSLKKSIEKNKEECSKAISSSMETIQSEIKTLKDLIMADPIFKETIKQELREELKRELAQELEL